MQLRLARCAVVLTLAMTGCPTDPGGDGETGDTTEGADTTTGDGGDDTPMTTMMPMSTDEESTAAVDDTTAAGSDTMADESDTAASTGPSCPPGTEGCACDGTSCDEGLACVEEVCVVGESCADHPEGEPNDTEAQAVDIGEVDGCAVDEVLGAIDSGDTDWFRYHGTHDPLCNSDTAALTDSDPELETCMYFECDQGNPQVVCFGTPVVFSPGGLPGCCDTGGNSLFMSRNCLGVGEQPDGTIYMEVRGPDEPMCVEYALAYLF